MHPYNWGSKRYFESTMHKPTLIREAFHYGRREGFQHLMFNDVDVAWARDMRKEVPRVPVFAAQNRELGTPWACSGKAVQVDIIMTLG